MSGRSRDPKTRVLVLNASETMEGDISTLVELLRQRPSDGPHFVVVSQPGGEVHTALQRIPDLTVHEMQLGGSERDFVMLQRRWLGRTLQLAFQAFTVLTRLVLMIRREQIDVVYAIDRGIAPKIGVLAAQIAGVPFVLNSAYPFYPSNGRTARHVLKHSTRLHVHSEYLKQLLAPTVPQLDRMVVLQYGIDVPRYDPTRDGSSMRAAYGLGGGDHVVAMMGRLSQWKGQDDLIRAAAIVVREDPKAHFLIAGRGDYCDDLVTLIEEVGVTDRVQLVGYVPDLPEFIAGADVVTMPSVEEPFGLVALEGMAMSKPVVATRAGGVPEFVEDGVVGILVPPRDPPALAAALLELLRDPSRREAMGRAGRRRVEAQHTPELYVQGVINVIEGASRQHHIRHPRRRRLLAGRGGG